VHADPPTPRNAGVVVIRPGPFVQRVDAASPPAPLVRKRAAASTVPHQRDAGASGDAGDPPKSKRHKAGHGKQPQQCHAWAETGRCARGKCRFDHGNQPAGGAPQRTEREQLRPYFDKLTHDSGATMGDSRAAARFAEATKAYADDDLLWCLTRRDGQGLRRIQETVQLGEASAAIMMIKALMHARWGEPKYSVALATCVRALWAVPEWVEKLASAVSDGAVREASGSRALEASELKALTDFPSPLPRPTSSMARTVRSTYWPRRW